MRRLLAIGGLLLVAAIAAWAVNGLRAAGGYDWPEAALVPLDGSSHTVPVSPGRHALVWTLGDGASGCRISDPGDGSELAVASAAGVRARNGKIADWVAESRFTPRSATVEVTCDRVGAGNAVAVEPAPHLPPALESIGLLPLSLGAAGVAVCLAALLYRSARPEPVRTR